MNSTHVHIKHNLFDFIRLILALLICLFHIAKASQESDLGFISDSINPSLVIQSFFILSGFLIFSSFKNSTSISNYFFKRFRRIYPAYFVTILLSAISLYFISNTTLTEYFNFDLCKYIAVNLLFLNFIQPDLPFLFQNNPLNAINASLWTIKIEISFYLLVPLLFILIKKWGQVKTLLALYLCSIIYTQLLTYYAELHQSKLVFELARQLPGQLCYFIAGGFFYLYLERIKPYLNYLLLITVPLLFFPNLIIYPILQPIALTSIIIAFAYSSKINFLQKLTSTGDYSYGIYILHFPILQVYINMGLSKESPFIYLIFTLVTTLTLSILLWHSLEKRFLKRNKRLTLNNIIS